MEYFHSIRVINIRILLTRNKLTNSRNHPLPDYRKRIGKDLALFVSALWRKEQCPCPQTSLFASLLVSSFLCPGREEESALEEWRGCGLPDPCAGTAVKDCSLLGQTSVVSCSGFLLCSCVKLFKHRSLSFLIYATKSFSWGCCED